MKPLIRSLLFALALLPSTGFGSPTDHGDRPPNWLAGSIPSGTLTAASPGPTYVVYGDLTVVSGATLTIEPGVTLQPVAFSDFLASGVFRDKIDIVVRGSLVAQGTLKKPINFIPSQQSRYAWGGFFVESGGSLALSHATISSAYFGVRASGGAVSLSKVTASGVEIGFDLETATGTVQSCSLYGFGFYTGTYGIRLGPAVSTAAPDSLLPEPTRIASFEHGVDTTPGSHAQHLLITNCSDGIRTLAPTATVSYCTIASNVIGIASTNTGIKIYNSIVAYNSSAAFAYYYPFDLSYADVWKNGPGYGVNVPLGGWSGRSVATFDPDFVGPGNYHLNPTSLFTDFSVSGGQIGAYGPGGGQPRTVIAEAAKLVSADVDAGVVRITWYVANGERSSVFRREDGQEWQVWAPVRADGRGYIVFEDEAVVPGHRYGYGLGVSNWGSIEIQGEAWVEVPVAAGLAILGPQRNPALAGSLVIAFSLPNASPATVALVDVSGRRVVERQVGQLGAGRHAVDFNVHRPGIYWLRLSQGGRSLSKKLCILQ